MLLTEGRIHVKPFIVLNKIKDWLEVFQYVTAATFLGNEKWNVVNPAKYPVK